MYMVREPKRVLFMGTPEFAVPSLRALVEHAAPGRLWPSGLDIIGVVTRVDKPVGRGRQVVNSPVKQFALDRGIPVLQPGSLRRPEALEQIKREAPDVIVVAAFGQILPKELLELPSHCCLNVHASLLPRYRGASPIASAILAGDTETGVSIMLMEEGLDTGPVLARRAISIAGTDTTGTLTAKLATVGADVLVATLPLWLADGIEPEPQDDALATLTRPIRKEDARLDWTRPASELARAVRAYQPWPGAFTLWNSHQVKIVTAHGALGIDTSGRAPGTCFLAVDSSSNRELVCACGQGALALDVIQLEGKRAMPSADVLRGHPALAGAAFSA